MIRAASILSGVAVLAAPPVADARRPPGRLQVTATEYRLALSRATVPAGPVIVELVDLGEDDHDLALRRLGASATTRRVPTTGPGTVRAAEVRLRPGRYRLWCTLLDHRARGMRALLVVRSSS